MQSKLQEKSAETDWYNLLIEDCQAILTEAYFTSSWVIIEAYHEVGMRILKEKEKFKEIGFYGREIVKRVSQSLGKSDRTIYKAVQFATKFDDLNSLPEGKNTSWHKICNKYLPEDNKDIEPRTVCPTCKGRGYI